MYVPFMIHTYIKEVQPRGCYEIRSRGENGQSFVCPQPRSHLFFLPTLISDGPIAKKRGRVTMLLRRVGSLLRPIAFLAPCVTVLYTRQALFRHVNRRVIPIVEPRVQKIVSPPWICPHISKMGEGIVLCAARYTHI